ncbi:MAG: hypothetical protein KBT11_01440, partial [Treponema sp.]|nr:hypothetical protein [Candidatus Treponema equifaecale]
MILAVAGCFSKEKKAAAKTNEEPPAWVTDSGRYKIFPKTEYLSACEYGSSLEEAKTKAAASISKTIKAQVTDLVKTDYSAKENQGSYISHREISENLEISSSNSLYQLEYTTPFYSKELGMYIGCAYINRQKAFDFVEPKLNKCEKNFPAEYEASIKKNDALEQLLGIKNSLNFAKEFYEYYDFARVINPAASEKYAKVDELFRKAEFTLNELKSKCAVNIVVEGDFNNQVLNALQDAFNAEGLTVVQRGAYDYKAKAVVSASPVKTAQTVQCRPSVLVEVLGGSEVKYSWSKQMDKVAAFDEDSCLRR